MELIEKFISEKESNGTWIRKLLVGSSKNHFCMLNFVAIFTILAAQPCANSIFTKFHNSFSLIPYLFESGHNEETHIKSIGQFTTKGTCAKVDKVTKPNEMDPEKFC